MVRRKTSEGFARVMSKVLKYLVMFVVIYYFAAAAFVFGRQLFTDSAYNAREQHLHLGWI
mgnify:CR=1 FL=1